MKSPNPKTFCLAPWTAVNLYTSGELAPCRVWHTSLHQKNVRRPGHESDSIASRETPIYFYDYDKYINSNRMIETRKNQYHGVQVDSCKRCYEDERAGKQSVRKVYNKTFAKNFDFKQINESFTISANSLTSVDIKFGNICNLKCVFCFGNISSAILSEYNQHQNKFQQLEFFEPVEKVVDGKPVLAKGYYEWPNSEEFSAFFDRIKDQLRWISFTGGEPTVNTKILDLLNTIDQPELVTLSLTTNGSTEIQEWLSTLSRFKQLWINLSLEGTHDQARQIRYPSSWELIEKNIITYKNMPNCYFFISHLLQSFSVSNLVGLIKWCDTQDIKINIMQLTSPKYLTLNSVPPSEITVFRDALQQMKSNKNQDVIDFALVFLSDYQYDTKLHQQRLRYLETLDSIRGTTLRQDYQ